MRLLLILLAAGLAIAAAPAARPVSIDLPFDATLFGALGPGAPPADAINNNCLSCHSAEMVLNQPALSRLEWAGEVAKMRTVYKAPVAEADDAAIIDWLTAMSARLPQRLANKGGG
jgi:hypothetical protein